MSFATVAMQLELWSISIVVVWWLQAAHNSYNSYKVITVWKPVFPSSISLQVLDLGKELLGGFPCL